VNAFRPATDAELDIGSLRTFIAVAEELSFTRAAERLLVAQQAVSRDIRRLEERLGIELFVRTTRRVTLTDEGHRLLVRARELVALHDELLADLGTRRGPIVIDLMSEGRRTGRRILETVRAAAPDREFRGQYGDGMGRAVARLGAGEIDVALGRADWAGRPGPEWPTRDIVRWEPLALLLPATHELAGLEAVPIASLAGREIDANPGSPDAAEWVDLARQLLAYAGARPTPPHRAAVGAENQADHLVRQGLPILTGLDHADVPGGVIRPLVDPVPCYPWSILWGRRLDQATLRTIRRAVRDLARAEGWLHLPDGAWLPAPEAGRATSPARPVPAPG
jgi:DNA-binding transcriptional LysR family regulator